jgi:hypothetical protein
VLESFAPLEAKVRLLIHHEEHEGHEGFRRLVLHGVFLSHRLCRYLFRSFDPQVRSQDQSATLEGQIKEMIPAIYLTWQPESAKCGKRTAKIKSKPDIRPSMEG